MSSLGRDASADPEQSFAKALPALKRQGCSVLVVGAVPEDIHKHACERLLGDADAGPRQRLIVRGHSIERLGAEATIDPSARVIEHEISARASAAHPGTIAPSGGKPGVVEPGGGTPSASPDNDTASSAGSADTGLSALGDEILAAIRAIEASTDTLSAAELRVCIDSLVALVDAHDHEAVTRLLRPVFAAVHEVRGMAHAHLPVARDAAVVEALSPVFDAVVGLRVESGRPQQRWELRDGPSSAWLPLPSPSTDTRGGGR